MISFKGDTDKGCLRYSQYNHEGIIDHIFTWPNLTETIPYCVSSAYKHLLTESFEGTKLDSDVYISL